MPQDQLAALAEELLQVRIVGLVDLRVLAAARLGAVAARLEVGEAEGRVAEHDGAQAQVAGRRGGLGVGDGVLKGRPEGLAAAAVGIGGDHAVQTLVLAIDALQGDHLGVGQARAGRLAGFAL